MFTKKRLLSLIGAIAMLLVITTVALASAIVYVTPEFLSLGDGNVSWGAEQADGSYSILLNAANGAAAFTFQGVSTEQLLAAGVDPYVLLQSVSAGGVFGENVLYEWDEGIALWGQQPYPGGLNDPGPFYYTPPFVDAVFPDGPPAPDSIFNVWFFIAPGGNPMSTEVWELCLGNPGGENGEANDGPNHRGDAICFRFVMPELGDARIPMYPVGVSGVPKNEVGWVRTWYGPYTLLEGGTHGVITDTLVTDFGETGESTLFHPGNYTSDTAHVKASFASSGDKSPVPVVIDFYGLNGEKLASCPTWQMHGTETVIAWDDCAHGVNIHDLAVMGELDHLYSALVRSLTSDEGVWMRPGLW